MADELIEKLVDRLARLADTVDNIKSQATAPILASTGVLYGGTNNVVGSDATNFSYNATTHALTLTGNLLLTGGMLKIGAPAYSPAAGEISSVGAIISGAGLYPSNQTTYFLSKNASWAGLYVNGALAAAGNIYPGNQNSYYLSYSSAFLITNANFQAGGIISPSNQSVYYWDVGTHTIANTMYTNANLESGARIYASDWFRSIGATGWYNHTYGGGIFMQNTSNVEVYGGKYFYAPTALGVGLSPVIFAGTWRFGVDGLGTTNATYSAVFRNSAGTNLMYLQDGGGAWVNSAWTVSDEREKHDIEPIADAQIDDLLLFDVKQFIRNISGEPEIGFIAQQIAKIDPNIAKPGMYGIYGIRESDILARLVAGYQRQHERIGQLEARLATAEKE